jgi:GDP-L-fucose synthase
MENKSKIYVAGHNGMVGSAIVRCLEKNGYTNIIKKTSNELDLRCQDKVEKFFAEERPDYVFLAAAKVGGIMSNISAPAEYLYDNLALQNNIIHFSYKYNVKKLLFLASSCIYPRLAPQPMKEVCLMDGKVEPTNEGYAIAKIAGLKMCEMYNRQYSTNFISVMPCNIYGINDKFDSQKSHVVPALICKFHEAKVNQLPYVEVWGTGSARRELLFADDLADACFYLFKSYSGNEFFNIGTGIDYSISELAEVIKKVVGFNGEIYYDKSKPDGMPQKLMDVSKLRSNGWKYKTSLVDGIKLTYDWYKNHVYKKNQLGVKR